MNILTRSLSLPFAACFGVIAPLVFKIVFETKQALEYTGPLWGRRKHEFIVGVHGAAFWGDVSYEFIVGVHGAALGET